MTLLHPWWLLLAFIFFLGFCLLKLEQNSDDWHRILKQPVLLFFRPLSPARKQRNYAWLLASLSAIALASPSIPKQDKDTYHHAEGWFVLADVSRSMTLEDIAPSRLSAMRDTAQQLANVAESRPIALIIYAGDAFMLTPPAFDSEQFMQHAAVLKYGLVPQDGSNLTRALALTTSVIESSQLLQARIFVLSDTGGFNTKAQAAVAHLAAQGHSTDFVIFGSVNSSANAEFDMAAAHNLADAGQGNTIVSNTMGMAELDKLDLQRQSNRSELLLHSGIVLLRWDSLSHWILLPALLLLFSLFLRERT